MINYRVTHIGLLIEALRKKGVKIVDELKSL